MKPALVVALLVLLPQSDVTDADLISASGGRTVQLGALATGRVTEVPLELYVARVLAGEAEPGAADAAQEALAVAIRTFALANAGRHGRDGFDLCDSTHCQVPRAATAATRRAALATAGRVLLYNGQPAEVFYSASCGGHSENASELWPGADFPYLRGIEDDVHGTDQPWTLELRLRDVEQALRRAGWEGTLHNLAIEGRNGSGRVTRLRVIGMRPDAVDGDDLRAIIGATMLRSTAFELQSRRGMLRFTGRGYGHGVGLCVVGAGRRALRGESMQAILATYFPGLELGQASGAGFRASSSRPGAGTAARANGTVASASRRKNPLDDLAARIHGELSKQLGVSVGPITVQQHDTIDAFRRATNQPWWTAVVASTLAVSAAAQREAEVRAEQCFARALQRGASWRDVR